MVQQKKEATDTLLTYMKSYKKVAKAGEDMHAYN